MTLTTKEAVNYVLQLHCISKYKLATTLGAAPVSVNQWLRNTKMSSAYRELFKDLYQITVRDDI